MFDSFEGDEGTFDDLMVRVEPSDRASVAEKATGLPGFRVAANVGRYGFPQAIEDNLDALVAVAVSPGLANYIRREKVKYAANVKVLLPEIAGGHLNKPLPINVCGPT